jgi:hypothetical protein
VRELRCSVMFVLCVATSACGSGAKNADGAGGSGGSGGTNTDAAVNGTSCDTFTACGGNIVGTWRLVSTCLAISSSGCPSSERISVQTSPSQVTYTFAGDGTLTLTASGQVTEALRYPLACLGSVTDAGIPQACADTERVLVTPPQTADAGTSSVEVTSASCAAAANEACACTVVVRYTSPQTASGAYATSGSQLTLVGSGSDGGAPDAGASSVSEYCVAGNTLTIHTAGNTSDGVATLTR